jgi:hypothetical protein
MIAIRIGLYVLNFIIGILIILIIVFYLMISNFFKKRNDYKSNIDYLFFSNFNNLVVERINFKTSKNVVLKGNFVSNKMNETSKGLAIFIAGYCPGRYAYTSLINAITEQGFDVFCYDNYGCGESGGKNLKNWYQPTVDLENALSYLDKIEKYKNVEKVLIGHSQGGYTSFAILKKYPNYFSKIINISGANSFFETASEQYKLKGLLKLILKIAIYLHSGKNDNIKVSDCISNTTSKLFYLIGEKDQLIKREDKKVNNLSFIKTYIDKNVSVRVFNNSYHNPYQTNESEQYMLDFYKHLEKKEAIDSKFFDLPKLTEISKDFVNYLEEVLK